MSNSRSIQDVMGNEYALIVSKNGLTGLDWLEKEFPHVCALFRVVLLDTTAAISVYGSDLLLVGPTCTYHGELLRCQMTLLLL
jgi:hypothetical protein